MKHLRDIAPFAQWCGSELAVVLDEQGQPYIFAELVVWPESQGPTAGAHLGITRNVDNTVQCFFTPARPVRLGAVTNSERDKMFEGGRPKYLRVQRIFVGEQELPLPIAHSTR